MSGAEEGTNKGPREEELTPTASFSGSIRGPGSRIGPFRVERELGRGAVGVVYLAHDTKLDRLVAIKSLPAEVTGNGVVRARFQREARLLASFNHPNIATIYEELEEAEGVGYLILEYIPGQTLAERISKGPLKLEEVLSIVLQIAEAVAAAHKHHVIHRDLKPSNIKITPEGNVKVLDFGVAKMVAVQSLDQQITDVTQPGQVIGTPGYMSPEQALGKEIDHRSDIWSFGCVLYEMLTSKCPFPGQTTSDVLESILKTEPNWEALPPEIPLVLRDLVHKCLEKDPERRYQSATELCQDLLDYQATLAAPAPKAIDLKALLRLFRRPRFAILSVVVFMLFCIAALWLINQSAKVRWARVEAIPEISRLIEQDKYFAAFSIAREAEKYISKDPMLIKLWTRVCKRYSITTTPSGADIFLKEHSEVDNEWEYLGQSPLRNVRFPRGLCRWKIEKEGYTIREGVAGLWSGSLNIDLWEENSLPSGMVRIPPCTLKAKLWPSYKVEPVEAPAYWIDKYEVTNEQFKQFIDAGGYGNPQYWKHKFIKDGQELSWERAMREFRDRTGRAGPSTWEGGTYPKGKDKFPVCGVSWYEASAYAEFAGKGLPTVHHWTQAACTGSSSAIVPFSNFGGRGPAPVGMHVGMYVTGLYDMAGNVKEWCQSATSDSGDRRYILGGAWSEQTYMFTNRDSRSVWDRSPSNGFRCVQYAKGREEVPDFLFRPIEPSRSRDYSKETPASEEQFQFFKRLYAYDRTELNVETVSLDDRSDYWRKERVTFDAAYGGERVIAYLFLPKKVRPPYQAVVYFPGWGATDRPREDFDPGSYFWDFIIMSGRAFMYPVYKGTHERRYPEGRRPRRFDEWVTYQEWIIQLSKDLGRSIDYLESRDDIDGERIAYYGLSWGARLGSIMLAVEDRVKTGIFFLGGFSGYRKPAAIDEINFTPYVKIPVLMINGREDFIFPLETSQTPMYEFLGTPSEHKKHILYPGGHDLLSLFSGQIRKDILDWLDRYLGPVD